MLKLRLHARRSFGIAYCRPMSSPDPLAHQLHPDTDVDERLVRFRRIATREPIEQARSAVRGRAHAVEEGGTEQQRLEAEFFLELGVVHQPASDHEDWHEFEILTLQPARDQLVVDVSAEQGAAALTRVLPTLVDEAPTGVSGLRIGQERGGLSVHKIGSVGSILFPGLHPEHVQAALERHEQPVTRFDEWIRPNLRAWEVEDMADGDELLDRGQCQSASAAIRRFGIFTHFGVSGLTMWAQPLGPRRVIVEAMMSVDASHRREILEMFVDDAFEPNANLTEIENLQPPWHQPIAMGAGVLDLRIRFEA